VGHPVGDEYGAADGAKVSTQAAHHLSRALIGAVSAMADLASLSVGPMAGGADADQRRVPQQRQISTSVDNLAYVAHTSMNCANTFLCTEAGCASSNGNGIRGSARLPANLSAPLLECPT
jgi:hypothetical protein